MSLRCWVSRNILGRKLFFNGIKRDNCIKLDIIIFTIVGLPRIKVTKTRYFVCRNGNSCVDDGDNGYTIYFGMTTSKLAYSDYMRIKFKDGIPNLQFKIFNVKGNFRGNVVTTDPTPAPTKSRYNYGIVKWALIR